EYHTEDHISEKQNFLRRFQQGFERSFERFREGYQRALEHAIEHSQVFTTCFLLFCVLSCTIAFVLDRDFFPSVDAGQMRLHLRARTGLRIEETARLTDQVNQTIKKVIPKNEIVTVLNNIGLPYSGINLTYSNAGTIGTSDAEVLIQLKDERSKGTAEYINKLRAELPHRVPAVQLYFQPADIVTQMLNFGTPAPIDISILGPVANQQGNYLLAEKFARDLRHVPGAVDVHVQQAFDAPTLHFDIDRTRAQYVGLQTRDV